MFEVRVSRSAAAYLKRLDRTMRERVLAKLDELAGDPFSASKALKDAGERRSARVGGLRIVLTVDVDAKVVGVSHIGPRGEIYRKL